MLSVQTVDIIFVNLWQILISLLNLVIIFLILKKFLFKPVKNMLAKRQGELDERYDAAARAEAQATADKTEWEEKLRGAEQEADAILQSAAESAKFRSDKLVEEAKEKADGIVRRAEAEAELERRKATEGIKTEIVEVSTALAEKMLGREINEEDHRAIIDSFIEDIGNGDDGNE